MTEYEAVIGLETHVQLKTKSKMWCGCANTFGAEPNTNVCPVCLGMPGVLPVPNEEAIRLTVLTGYLLNCEVPGFAKFDRKSYFYPDVAKNYQITQYDKPSTVNGFVEFEWNGRTEKVRITRAHLEEDVGKNTHFERHSGVDFNRAGVPLLEIVSEPDLTSADMAYAYLNALTEILRQGGISDCDMEKGMVRCDVNVSVRPRGSTRLGSKIEIKNMNSFSGVRRALEHEIPRQIEALSRGEKLPQSTRRWDDVAGITEQMRTKEDAHDYRYFPDPDLMPLVPGADWLAGVKARVIELPLIRKQRLMRDYHLPTTDAEVFKGNPALSQYFETIAPRAKNPKSAANWLINNLLAQLSELNNAEKAEQAALGLEIEDMKLSGLADLKFQPEALLELIHLVEAKTISSSAAQQVFAEMFATGKAPDAVVKEKGLAQVSDTVTIEKFCEEAIAANAKIVADYQSGKTAALNSLKGQVMKLSRGKANPILVGEILERKLKGQ
ncbi:MAG: Asp-tRNA(Asn)/Glu-tRNA(Gln) amidotransferase subunit GatB [Verrucomicrobiae bacterium]|nr:Asp-tRNA(Asn)/Glu-tRNA(Gln) amidotransferase subunit GatB [Verrucomicrobiae bacterium]